MNSRDTKNLRMKEQVALQRILMVKYEELRSKDSRFSRRAFSKRLGLSAGAMSELLNGRRSVSIKLIQRICERLGLDPSERAKLLDLYSKKKTRDQSRPETEVIGIDDLRLSADQFRVIGDWYHFAILSLMDTSDFRSEIPWIAERLGISVATARSAVERLIRLGIVQEDEKGHFTYSGQTYRTPDDVPDAAIRLAHFELLDKARKALDSLPVDERDFTSVILRLSPEQLPRAKEMIRRFQNKLLAELAANPQSEVYQLGMQLFPLSRVRKNHDEPKES